MKSDEIARLNNELAEVRKELKKARKAEQDALAKVTRLMADYRRDLERERAESVADLRELMEEEREARLEWHERYTSGRDDELARISEELGHDLSDRATLLDTIAKLQERVARLTPKEAGRRRAATPAQEREILKRRDKGDSLRAIAAAVGLGLRSVRTVVEERDTRRTLTARENAKLRARRYRAAKAVTEATAAERKAWDRYRAAQTAVGEYVYDNPLPPMPRAGEV